MDPNAKHSKTLTKENLPTDLVDRIQSVDFEYPENTSEDIKHNREDMEEKLRRFLISFLSLDPYDFIIFQQRVIYHLNVREIARFPLLPGRMAVRARCEEMAKKLPLFRGALLAGFDNPEENEEEAICKINKKKM